MNDNLECTQLLLLSEAILAKHTKDAAASPLPPSIIAELETAKAKAALQKAAYDALFSARGQTVENIALKIGNSESQSTYSSGNLLFYLASVRDILHGWFREEPKKITDWGFTVNTGTGRTAIPLPTDPADIILLAGKILAKHGLDKDDSPLKSLHIADMQTVFDTVSPALPQLVQARKDMETATEARNKALGIHESQNSKTKGTVFYFVCSVRDILQGVHREFLHRLGDWGFVVNAAKKGKEAKIGEGEKK